MKRIVCFTLASWLAAAVLYLGQHSVAMMALSGVLMLAALDLCGPHPAEPEQ